jgi:hypothetical protein
MYTFWLVRETLSVRCLARGLETATLARHGRPCGEQRCGKVTRSGLQPWGVAYNGSNWQSAWGSA